MRDAVGAEGRGQDLADDGGGERAVEVGKEVPAPGRLPDQSLPEVVALDLQHHQVGLAREVPGGGLGLLGGGGEVDEARAGLVYHPLRRRPRVRA